MTDLWGVDSVTAGFLTEAAQVLIEKANQGKQELHDALLQKFTDEMRSRGDVPSPALAAEVLQYNDIVRVIDGRISELSSLLDPDAAPRRVVQTIEA